MHLVLWLAGDRGKAAPAATVCVRDARSIPWGGLLVCPGVPVWLTRAAWPRRGPAGARRLPTCGGREPGPSCGRQGQWSCTVQRTTI